MRHCIVVTLVVVFAGVACDAKSANTSSSTVQAPAADTAPPMPIVGEAWDIDSLEHIRVTGFSTADSLVPLTDVRGAARTEHDRVVVADGHISALEFYNGEGEYERTLGDKGSGKNEFSRLTRMLHCGAELYVEDLPQRHFKVFTADGKVLRTFALPTDSAGDLAAESVCNADGVTFNVAAPSQPAVPAQPQVVREPATFWLSNSKGKLQHSFGKFLGSEYWFNQTATGGEFTERPLGRRTHIAIGRQRVYIGTSDSLLIDVLLFDGVPVNTIRKPVPLRLVTPAVIARFKQRDTIGLPTAEVANRAHQWATIEFPKTLSAYTAMVVDSADNLWVRAQPPTTDDWVPWFIFDADGKEVAHASMPQSFRVLEIGSDWVLGIDEDVTTRRLTVKAFTIRRPM